MRPPVAEPSRLREVIAVFLKLGLIGFGGPAAHIAMMREEVVRRRRWLDDQRFLDLLGATNLIPGPNSTEMTIHLGYLRAGWPGLIAGGVSFVLPAMVIVLGLAWAYVRYGSSPAAGWLLYGVKPVVIALIVHALWELGRKSIRNAATAIVGVGVLALSLLGFNEIALLFAGGLIVMLVANRARLRRGGLAGLFPVLGISLPVASAAAFSLPVLFLTCLKIGAILYGSGYVLLAFLRADFVTRLGWLTDQQLLDAIAVGQVTPGPLFTTATFIGYVLGGLPGAILGTLGLFLPSLVFVALSHPLIPRMRRSPWLGSLLDGVIAASLGLMAAVTLQIARASLVDVPTVILALISTFALVRLRINSTWLVAGGALAGLAVRFFAG
ncbi:MAG: chromate transporter [Chloroflexi bacterium RBG_13_66_10]|nr:MAG: chromate transporter [Chloroflexi bacterium RBG_13_66_10]